MAQHIPGPYTFDLDEGAIESADGVQIATIPSVDEFPCRDTEKDDEFEAELVATGRLLAAAPELLAASKIVFQMLCGKCGDSFRDLCPTTWREFQAAIAKAEGRS